MNILSVFQKKKAVTFVPTREFLSELPQSDKVFEIAQNKELTDTKAFRELLSYYQHFPLKEIDLLQNRNQTILSFRKNIYEVSLCMSSIVRSFKNDSIQITNFIRRLGLDQHVGFLFFTDKPTEEYATIDQEFISQLVGWMESTLDYYEANKISMEDRHDELCSAIHSRLNVFYDFFYYLVCYLANVRCDHLNSVARSVTIEF